MTLREQVSKLVGREVGVEQTKTGKWICQYVDFNMSPKSLVGDTEELAYEKLLAYLKAKETHYERIESSEVGDSPFRSDRKEN